MNIPEGWKLVPVEPEQQMVERGAQSIEDNGGNATQWYVREAWAEMLDAAPSPPAQGTKQLCELPKINAVFETVSDGVVGRTSAPVKRLEAEDDGSYSVVIDYWPTPPAQQDDEALYPLAMPAPLRLPGPMTDEAIYDNDAIMAANSLAGLLFGDFATVVRAIETEVLRRVRECNTATTPPAQQDDERDAETELNCAEEVLDGYAAHLDLKVTAFDCIGDYITAVCEALKAAAPTPPAQQDDEKNPWRDALENAGVISWTLTDETKDDPRKLLEAIIRWNVQVALDPAVSSEAQALIERGRQDDEALEVLRLALDALTCGDTGDDLEDSHRCGKCDEYVDRNAVTRQRIRTLLNTRGAA